MSKILVNEIGTWTGTEITLVSGRTLTGSASQFKITGGTAGQALITDGAGNISFGAVDSLPSQTGQAGKFLTTDGIDASWETVVTGGNPTTVSDQANTSTGYFDLPSGTTAQRPGTPATGNMRWNTTDEALEHYGGSAGGWVQWAGAAPTITSINPTTSIAAGTSINVQGINFQAGSVVKLIGVDSTIYNAASTSFVSTTEITFTTPELPVANEPFDVKVILPAGGFFVLSDALDAGGVPAWTTTAGSLGTISDDATGTHFTLAATDPDGQVVTFAETTSVLATAGLSLNSTTGAITGNPTNTTTGGSTVYSFDVDATDSTGVNTTSRSFSITVGDGWYGATGGTISTDGAYTLHTFTNNGTFNSGAYPGPAEVWVVGGGGGGNNTDTGENVGAGAGGGGMSYSNTYMFEGGVNYACTVGAGGTNATTTGQAGGDSSCVGGSLNMTASGGGGGDSGSTTGAGGTATGGDTNGTGGAGGAGSITTADGSPGGAGINGGAGGGGGGHNQAGSAVAGTGGTGDANYYTGGGGGGGNDLDGANGSAAPGGTGYYAGGQGGVLGVQKGYAGLGPYGGSAPSNGGSRNNSAGGGGTFGGGAGGTGGNDGGSIDGSHGSQGVVIIKYTTPT
jgi:hypothetical protein